MKKILLIVIITALNISAQEVYTLQKSLEVGLKNSKNLKISKADVTISKEKLTQIKSEFLPKLNFKANYTRLSDVDPFKVKVPFAPAPIEIQETILNNYGMQLSVSQPIFTGFKLSSLKSAASKKLSASELDLQAEINNEAMNIHQAFWHFYKSHKIVEIIKANLKLSDESLKDIENLRDNGLATNTDVLKIKVRKNSLELELINAENKLQIARSLFNEAIGRKITDKTDISIESLKTDYTIPEFEYLFSEAIQKRNEIQSTENMIEAGKENIEAAKASWYPQISLYGNFYYSRPNQRVLPLEDEFNDTWDLGVALNWELWNWGKTSSQKNEAKASLIKLKTSKNILLDKIKIEVYNNYLSLKSSIKKVEVSNLSVEQANENYKDIKNKLKEDLANTTELIDAETELLKAKINKTDALVDLKLSMTRLNKSIGKKIY